MNIPPPIPTASPFSPNQIAELAIARKAMKPIRRAVGMAQMDGWSLAVFAGLTLICGFSSLTAILVGVGLGVIAYIELRSIPKLRQLDSAVAKTLTYNQLALAALLILYAGYNLLFPTPLPTEVIANNAELKAAGIDMGSLQSMLNQVVYFALIAVAVGVQGSTALFYFRRTKMIESYLAHTPPWIVQMQKAGFNP